MIWQFSVTVTFVSSANIIGVGLDLTLYQIVNGRCCVVGGVEIKSKYKKLVYCRYRKRSVIFWTYCSIVREKDLYARNVRHRLLYWKYTNFLYFDFHWPNPRQIFTSQLFVAMISDYDCSMTMIVLWLFVFFYDQLFHTWFSQILRLVLRNFNIKAAFPP